MPTPNVRRGRYFTEGLHATALTLQKLNFLHSCESVHHFNKIIIFVIAFELSAYNKTVAACSVPNSLKKSSCMAGHV